MSTITRSGGSMLSVVTSLWLALSRASSLPRKKRSTPATRIVATAMNIPPSPLREKSPRSVGRVLDAAYERGLALIERGEHFAAHEALEEAWRGGQPPGARPLPRLPPPPLSPSSTPR